MNIHSYVSSGDWFTPEAYLLRVKKRVPETGTFYEIIHKKLQEKGMYEKSNDKLHRATHLSGTICSRLKNDRNYNPSIETIIAFGIGLGISAKDTEQLLRLKKYSLSPEDPIHCAYMDLLSVYQSYGWGIKECNEILHLWGIDKKYFLGSTELDEEV